MVFALWTVVACLAMLNIYRALLRQAEVGPSAAPAGGGGSGIDIFASALADGGAAVVFFNRGTTAAKSSLALSELQQLHGFTIPAGKVTAHDVWSGKKLELQSVDAGGMQGIIALPSGNLDPHGSSFIRLTEMAA